MTGKIRTPGLRPQNKEITDNEWGLSPTGLSCKASLCSKEEGRKRGLISVEDCVTQAGIFLENYVQSREEKTERQSEDQRNDETWTAWLIEGKLKRVSYCCSTKSSNKKKSLNSNDLQVTGRSQMQNVPTKQRNHQPHCKCVPETGAERIQKEI